MDRPYCKRVHQRAAKDARHALSIETKERAVIAIALCILSLVLIWGLGDYEAAKGEFLLRLTGTVAIILAFPFIYAWKFISAPAKLHAEVLAENLALKADLSSDVRLNVNSRLTNLTPDAKHELYRVVTAQVEVHQLSFGVRHALEQAGFINPAHAYDPPEFIERYRPFIEQWFSQNPP